MSILAVTRNGKIGNRVGCSHYHQPGRPSPGTVAKRRLIRAKGTQRHLGSIAKWRVSNRSHAERPLTPETCSSSSSGDDDDTIPAGSMSPQPPPDHRTSLLQQLHTTCDSSSQNGRKRQSNPTHLRKLKQSYSSFIQEQTVLTERSLTSHQNDDLSKFIETPSEFVDSTIDMSDTNSNHHVPDSRNQMASGQLGIDHQPVEILKSSGLEVAILEILQKLKSHRKSFPASPSFSRIGTCLDAINTISRHTTGAISGFMKTLVAELSPAIFITESTTGQGRHTFHDYWTTSKTRIAELESNTSALKQQVVDLEDEKAKILEGFASDTNQLSKANSEIESLKQSLEKQQLKVSHHKDHNDFLNSQIDELQKALSRASKRCYDLCRVGRGVENPLVDIVGDSDKEIHCILGYNDPNFEDDIDQPVTEPIVTASPKPKSELPGRMISRVCEGLDINKLRAEQSRKQSTFTRDSVASKPFTHLFGNANVDDESDNLRPFQKTTPVRASVSSFHASEVSLIWDQLSEPKTDSQKSVFAFPDLTNATDDNHAINENNDH